MGAAGTYSTLADVESTLGMLIQANAAVKVGTESKFASLETTSSTYTAYTASIGLKANASFNLGELSELGVNISATIEPFEAVNVRQPTVYVVTEEETTVTLGVTQFDYRLLDMLVSTGVFRSLAGAKEYLITFGNACNFKTRPVNVAVSNVACYLPSTADARLGITGISMTFYDCLSTSGFNWDNITGNEINTVSIELAARPITTNSLGNQTGSIYIF